jgi:hypothetical protein
VPNGSDQLLRGKGFRDPAERTRGMSACARSFVGMGGDQNRTNACLTEQVKRCCDAVARPRQPCATLKAGPLSVCELHLALEPAFPIALILEADFENAPV